MGLKGNPATLRALRSTIAAFPRTLAADVARKSAPAITAPAQQAYDSGLTVYGKPRPLGVDGKPLSLVRDGDARRDIKFTAIGTTIRCSLGPKYAKYLVGKYQILPISALPAEWRARLGAIVKETKP